MNINVQQSPNVPPTPNDQSPSRPVNPAAVGRPSGYIDDLVETTLTAEDFDPQSLGNVALATERPKSNLEHPTPLVLPPPSRVYVSSSRVQAAQGGPYAGRHR